MRLKTTIIILLLLPILIKAQSYNRYKYEFTFGAGASNFMGDVSAPKNSTQLVWVKMFNTIGFLGDVGLKYNLEDRHYISGFLSLGQIYAEDPINNPDFWDIGRTMNSFFIEPSFRYEFMVLKEKRRSTVYRMLGESRLKNFSMPTYLFIGGGAYMGFGNYSKINDKVVFSEFFTCLAPVMPLGVGFMFRLDKLNYITVEAGARFVLSDKLDNVESGWFDQYQFITVNYSYKLRAKQNGLPRFGR